jgi:NhaP-type Na+/H+ or K+/H+ antiporter
MISHDLLSTIIFTIVLGVACIIISEKARIPSIIFLLTIGVISGPDLLGIINPSLLGKGLWILTELAIAVILFEGGLTLNIKNVLHLSKPIVNLITLGALITWIGGAAAAKFILGVSWTVAILFGSLVIVTGPTVIGPLLRTVKVTKGIKTILKWESILIDPVGVIIAVLVLGFFVSEEATLMATISGFAVKIIVGILIGIAGGYLMSLLLKMKLTESSATLMIFAVVFLMFGVSEQIIADSGIMSVTVAGIVIGNLKIPNISIIKGFKEKLTLLLVSSIFVLLAANLKIVELKSLGWHGIAVVACLMFIVRPLNIFASVRDSSVSVKEKVFLSWVAPRGIIAAAVASLFTLTLSQRGFEDAPLLSSLTFMTIAITVFVQGITAKPFAELLGVQQTGSKGVLILGGNKFSIELAKVLSNNGFPVSILDSNKLNCHYARQQGITAFCGDVLDENIWDEIDLSSTGYFYAATSNNELNSLACINAKQAFYNYNIFQIRNSYKEEKQSFNLSSVEANQKYDLSLDIIGVSDSLEDREMEIQTVEPDELGKSDKEEKVILGFNKKIIFSTNPAELTAANKIAVLKSVRL